MYAWDLLNVNQLLLAILQYELKVRKCDIFIDINDGLSKETQSPIVTTVIQLDRIHVVNDNLFVIDRRSMTIF